MSLLHATVSRPNLDRAWAAVLHNDLEDRELTAGVKRFSENLGERLTELAEQVIDGTYEPADLIHVAIPKSDGGTRDLHIPAVRDRVLERALVQTLTPIIDPELHPWSFAYRSGLGVRDAVAALTQLRDDGWTWVLRADIHDCFDTLERSRILTELANFVHDPALINLVGALLERRTLKHGRRRTTDEGAPQGGPLSPLLCNLYLHRFDQRLFHAGLPVVRYADDMAIAARTEAEAQRALRVATSAAEDIGLTLGDDKTQLTNFDNGFVFLGEDFGPTYPAHDELAGIDQPDRKTLYVFKDGALVRLSKGQIIVSEDDEDHLSVPCTQLRALVLGGAVGLSAGARTWVLANSVDVCFLSRRGKLQGWLRGSQSPAAATLRHQLATTSDPEFATALARNFVAGKLANLRNVLLHRPQPEAAERLERAAQLIDASRHAALTAPNIETLRGHEGAGSAAHFAALPLLLPTWVGFEGRNRQPPTDPVNAALSFGYTMLSSEAIGAIAAAGLEPTFGYLHTDHEDRPSLALDLMEEFRPLIDGLVLTMFRHDELKEHHFRTEEKSSAVLLTENGRKKFIDRYEQRMLRTFRHEPTGRSVPYRLGILLQAKQLSLSIRRRTPTYQPVLVKR